MVDPTPEASVISGLFKLLNKECEFPIPGLWWFSFADKTGFLGVVVVEAEGYMQALIKTIQLDLNPGGEVMGLGPMQLGDIASEWRDRLLSFEETQQIPEPERFSEQTENEEK